MSFESPSRLLGQVRTVMFLLLCGQNDGPVVVSKNRGTPKKSILIRFSIINHPFWVVSLFLETPRWWFQTFVVRIPCQHGWLNHLPRCSGNFRAEQLVARKVYHSLSEETREKTGTNFHPIILNVFNL